MGVTLILCHSSSDITLRVSERGRAAAEVKIDCYTASRPFGRFRNIDSNFPSMLKAVTISNCILLTYSKEDVVLKEIYIL